MIEAANTTASPAAIWAIVIIMPIMALILILAPALADTWNARFDRGARGAGRLGPAIGDVVTHAGALGADTADADTASAGQAGAGAPAAGESTGAAERMPGASVPAPRTEPQTGERPGVLGSPGLR